MASSMEGLISPMRTCGLRSTSISKLTKMFASSSFNVPSPPLSKTWRPSIRCAVCFRPCIDIHKYVFNNGQIVLERLKALVRVVGKQRLVLDLSCRKKDSKYAIVTDRWQKFSDVFLMRGY
ncbi:hypothetical protein Ddye_008329 [Dipteronia dyeriana]|uniref:Uncharacterized protein n=1 Tax=Dipteronia dyeriana TaxID=168575 RepID=A0AAD9X9M3_9ROSI|nr:hypothetical protein Ddye_008329 [Dipteronia dyeriana]